MPKQTTTPGARLKAALEKHWNQPLAGKTTFSEEQISALEAMAKELDIQPVEVDVLPSDGELLKIAWYGTASEGWDAMAAEFLRLVRERDGEPKAVTTADVFRWVTAITIGANPSERYCEGLAARINAHRGVRELPQVTGAIARRCLVASGEQNRSDMWDGFAELLNAELAKLAGRGGAS